jgi:hypothetical protein
VLFNNPFTAILVFSASVLAASAPKAAPALAALAARAEKLGGVDLNAACIDQHYQTLFVVQRGDGCNA